MTRQIEMNFYVDNSAKENQTSMSGDLFAVVEDAEPVAMKLEHENSIKTVKITAHVTDQENDILSDTSHG